MLWHGAVEHVCAVLKLLKILKAFSVVPLDVFDHESRRERRKICCTAYNMNNISSCSSLLT